MERNKEGEAGERHMVDRTQNLMGNMHYSQNLERCRVSRSLQLKHYCCRGHRGPERDGKWGQT